MKLQIDTKAETIKVDENVKFNDLIKVLDKLLPQEWKNYTLETSGFITWYWYNPIPYYHTQPWRIGDVTYTSSGESVGGTVTNSVYNVDVIN
jgi:hypothetical protein